MKYLLLLCLLLAASCSRQAEPSQPSMYDEAALWYDNGREVDTALADVFYILPTCIHDWTDSAGVVQHHAALYDSLQRARMLPSLELADAIFGDSANFFSPYYRQISLESWMEDEDVISERFAAAFDDIRQAFDYYLREQNQGRPFVLAGFSQGARCVVELVKEMDDQTYQRMVAAYVCGYRVTAQDTAATRHLQPARGADDTGVTIVYNTVCDTCGISPSLCGDNIFVSNPASWTMDEALHPVNEDVSVRIDQRHKVLIAEGIDAELAFIPRFGALFPRGCLHLQELTLYNDLLRQNVKQRIAAYRSAEEAR